ncbi:acetyl-CoA synthetase (ADP-forming)/acetyltransferase [Candidatus Methanomarinus sp.]|nr:acetyl-CoA synthetase (ADP-forming)/acetyltransferase [ANME-2 cluster archaeon]
MTLKAIFEPGSVAIIGASSTPDKWGNILLKNLMSNGFKGHVYPVNPKEKTILGTICYPSVLDIPDPVDMALIAVPRSHALLVAKECGIKGVQGIIMVTAGFSETGDKGREPEKKLMEIIDRYDMRLVGPNTLGVVNAHIGMNASIISRLPEPGGISFITQSGTLGLALVDWTMEMGIGLHIVVSTGNKSNIDDVDLLTYLASDPKTDVIAMYVEGINRGREFIKVAKEISKPILVVKSGRTRSGSKAVFSHTGSMAGADEVYSAAFKQAGIIRVDNIENLFDSALALSVQPAPYGNRVGILSNGGGASIIASDACERMGLIIPALQDYTRQKIQEYIPEYASARNPIDSAGLATYDVYNGIVKQMLLDPNIDALIVIYVDTVVNDAALPAQAIVDIHRGKCNKPIIACWMGGTGTRAGVDILEKGGLPNYPVPERAVIALKSLVQHNGFLEKVKV